MPSNDRIFFFEATAAIAFQPHAPITIELVQENKNTKRNNSRDCIHWQNKSKGKRRERESNVSGKNRFVSSQLMLHYDCYFNLFLFFLPFQPNGNTNYEITRTRWNYCQRVAFRMNEKRIRECYIGENKQLIFSTRKRLCNKNKRNSESSLLISKAELWYSPARAMWFSSGDKISVPLGKCIGNRPRYVLAAPPTINRPAAIIGRLFQCETVASAFHTLNDHFIQLSLI